MRKKRTFSRNDILGYLEIINEKLAERGLHGNLNICGGAAMTLVYDARDSTYDIDAMYKPKEVMAGIIADIAKEQGLNSQWLNDDVSIFAKEFEKLTSTTYLKLSNLIVDVVDARFLLAMKLLAAREDSQDLHDASILIKHLEIKSLDALDMLIDTFEGQYHPKTLQVSREFAKAALKQAERPIVGTEKSLPNCKNSVLEQIAGDREKRRSVGNSRLSNRQTKKKRRNPER
jgi:hypothetical protein